MINADQNQPLANKQKIKSAFTGKKDIAASAPPMSTTKPPGNTEDLVADLPLKVGSGGDEARYKSNLEKKKRKNFLGLELRSVAAVAGIASFFVFSMAGVLIALRQQMQPEQVAVPTAPKSKPAAAEEPTFSCTLSFDVSEEASPSPSASPSTSPSPSPTPTPTPSPTPSPTPTPTPTPTPSPSPSASPTYSCNSDCGTNSQCETASSNYICYQNKCRLDSNPDASNCLSEEPETAINCNESCTANADCSNSAHICFDSACRLATNPTSATCSDATATQAPKGAQQPVLPEELPASGSEDVLDWLKAGLGVMGIGAVLLLLL